jgi:enoyl-CoA hydratase
LATLTIDNPSKHNALSVTMWRELSDHLRSVAQSQEVRTLLVRGAGDQAFAAGADISGFQEQRSLETAAHYDEVTEEALSSLTHLEIPTLAVVHGYCIGGGLSLALACDLRIADEAATFAIPAARLGLAYPPASLERLVGTLGDSAARMLLLSAQRLDSAAALHIGILHELHTKESLDRRAAELAQSLASLAPLSLRASKLQLRLMRESGTGSSRAPATIRAVQACLSSQDYQEGQLAFKEKRPPLFTGE